VPLKTQSISFPLGRKYLFWINPFPPDPPKTLPLCFSFPINPPFGISSGVHFPIAVVSPFCFDIPGVEICTTAFEVDASPLLLHLVVSLSQTFFRFSPPLNSQKATTAWPPPPPPPQPPYCRPVLFFFSRRHDPPLIFPSFFLSPSERKGFLAGIGGQSFCELMRLESPSLPLRLRSFLAPHFFGGPFLLFLLCKIQETLSRCRNRLSDSLVHHPFLV